MNNYAAFGGYPLGHPATTRKLDAMTEQIRQVDAVLAAQAAQRPAHCCEEYGFVVNCNGVEDSWACPVCRFTWETPCR